VVAFAEPGWHNNIDKQQHGTVSHFPSQNIDNSKAVGHRRIFTHIRIAGSSQFRGGLERPSVEPEERQGEWEEAPGFVMKT